MHRLDGPRAKIERADRQTKTLHVYTKGFFRRHPYGVVKAEFDKKAGRYSLRVSSVPPAFPDRWGVLIGEIAHNLRSALDGLAWQLALLKTDRPYERTAFPIYKVGHTKRRGRGSNLVPSFWGKGDGLRLMQDIPKRFWTRIESFQPYKRGNRGRHSPLFLLEELNNTDKHRLITLVATIVGGMEVSGLSGGSELKMGTPLHLNAKVGSVRPLPEGGVRVLDVQSGQVMDKRGRIRTRMQHEVQVDTRIAPSIRFGDTCEAVKSLPVIRTLQRMVDEVSRVIESFA
jgi:hypothetical protein